MEGTARSAGMAPAALLLVRPGAASRLEQTLAEVAEAGYRRLFVQLEDDCVARPPPSAVDQVYTSASIAAPALDVRVLLGKMPPGGIFLFKKSPSPDETGPTNPPSPFLPPYIRVCLGGTFDRLHNGHKMLLSRAALLASESIVCGVTDGPMIQKKKLWELMEPLSARIGAVDDFISSVSNVRVECSPITDPFGPSIIDPNIQALIVSEETVKGGMAVNDKRKERGMSEVVLEKIGLIGGCDAVLCETKLSSSSRRRELLGRLRLPVRAPSLFPDIYTIGLTGGIASGKSHVAQDLKRKGYEVIDCDRVAHECYATDAELVAELALAFPSSVSGGIVDRKALGALVFGSKEKLEQISNLVWPAVLRVLQARLAELPTGTVVFVEAAALVEAGWHEKLRETWTVFCQREEQISRVQKRDNLSQAQAEERVSRQLTNGDRIRVSNVVLCTDWERDKTKEHVEIACGDMEKRR